MRSLYCSKDLRASRSLSMAMAFCFVYQLDFDYLADTPLDRFVGVSVKMMMMNDFV